MKRRAVKQRTEGGTFTEPGVVSDGPTPKRPVPSREAEGELGAAAVIKYDAAKMYFKVLMDLSKHLQRIESERKEEDQPVVTDKGEFNFRLRSLDVMRSVFKILKRLANDTEDPMRVIKRSLRALSNAFGGEYPGDTFRERVAAWYGHETYRAVWNVVAMPGDGSNGEQRVFKAFSVGLWPGADARRTDYTKPMGGHREHKDPTVQGYITTLRETCEYLNSVSFGNTNRYVMRYLSGVVEDLRGGLVTRSEELARVQTFVAQAQKERDESMVRFQKLDEQTKDLKTRFERGSAQFEQLKAMYRDKEAELKRALDHAALEGGAIAENRKLEAEVESLKGQLETESKKVQDIQASLAEATTERDAHLAKITELEGKNRELESVLAKSDDTLSGKESELETMHSKMEAIVAEKEQLEKKVNGQQVTIRDLTRKRDLYQQEARSVQRELEELEKKRKSEIDAIQSQLKSLGLESRKSAEETSEARQTVADLQRQLQEAKREQDAEGKRLRELVTERERQVNAAELQLSAIQEAMEETKAELDDRKKQHTISQQLAMKTNASLAQKNDELRKIIEQQARLLEEAEQQQHVMQKSLEERADQLRKLQIKRASGGDVLRDVVGPRSDGSTASIPVSVVSDPVDASKRPRPNPLLEKRKPSGAADKDGYDDEDGDEGGSVDRDKTPVMDRPREVRAPSTPVAARAAAAPAPAPAPAAPAVPAVVAAPAPAPVPAAPSPIAAAPAPAPATPVVVEVSGKRRKKQSKRQDEKDEEDGSDEDMGGDPPLPPDPLPPAVLPDGKVHAGDPIPPPPPPPPPDAQQLRRAADVQLTWRSVPDRRRRQFIHNTVASILATV